MSWESSFPTYSQLNVGLFGASVLPPPPFEDEMREAGVVITERARGSLALVDAERRKDEHEQKQQRREDAMAAGADYRREHGGAGGRVAAATALAAAAAADYGSQPRLRKRSHHHSVNHMLRYEAHAKERCQKRPNPSKQTKRGGGGGGSGDAGPAVSSLELTADLLPHMEAIEQRRSFDQGGEFWKRVGTRYRAQSLELQAAAGLAASEVGSTTDAYQVPKNLARLPTKLGQSFSVGKAATVRRLPRSLVGPYGAASIPDERIERQRQTERLQLAVPVPVAERQSAAGAGEGGMQMVAYAPPAGRAAAAAAPAAAPAAPSAYALVDAVVAPTPFSYPNPYDSFAASGQRVTSFGGLSNRGQRRPCYDSDGDEEEEEEGGGGFADDSAEAVRQRGAYERRLAELHAQQKETIREERKKMQLVLDPDRVEEVVMATIGRGNRRQR